MFNIKAEKKIKLKKIKNLDRLVLRLDRLISSYNQLLVNVRDPRSNKEKTAMSDGLKRLGLASEKETLQ